VTLTSERWPQELLAVLVGDLLYEQIRAMAPRNPVAALRRAGVLAASNPPRGSTWRTGSTTSSTNHTLLAQGFGYNYLVLLRDNPRVPWALRDLCNPWAWAYYLDPSRLQYLKLSRHS